ncbi:NADH(P)-binding protein [Bellilinea caldifistulae]|uniref:NAD-dependent dehydratase n=1 Tax=Bellilinea caldifistulae TaxID=360411 RepID=A0A0P6X4T1_9CHLR|nr:SDR family oxidoreductase [Bellilinea caldifistulae]KPL74430.1 NAD-dependent dehydratase [Bellilinea caldifistulae]GAP11607.1 NADH(P)-binding protein [Bellilinea caldifistulae]
MSNQTSLHVVFGSGPLGLSVVDELMVQGQRVRLVNRSGKADVPAEVEIVPADVYDLQQALQACEGAAFVYQCAQPPYHQWVEKFPSLQQNILEACAVVGARLIIGENLYMYGEVDGTIHEGLPYAATTRKGQLRARMAEAALNAHQKGRLPAVIGRGSDFFGPRVLGSTLGERVFVPALRGKTASFTGNLNLPHSYTYIKDFGKALVRLATEDQAYGQVWHVPTAPAATQRQIGEMIFEILGQPPKMSGMGRWMMAIGGLFIPEARETVEMMYEFEKPFVMDSSKFTRAFGQTATPLRDALAETIDWYRAYLNQ